MTTISEALAGGPLTVQQLAAALGNSVNQMHQRVYRLEADGFVVTGRVPRQPGQSGRMQKVIALPQHADRLPVHVPRRVHVQPRGPRDAERAERMLAAYVNDSMTLEQVAAYHGVTRERVRQILNQHDATLYRLARRRNLARGHLRHFVNEGTISATKQCATCGSDFQSTHRGPRTYCCTTHQQVAIILRYQTNDEYRTQLRTIIAEAHLRSETTKPWQKRHAQRLIEGKVGDEDTNHRFGTRYLVPGSLVFHWAVRAGALGWPLFDRLHPDVQAQIREHLAQ